METLEKKAYYPRIDFYRFVFTIFVVILHFECFYKTKPFDNVFALYRSVDFFFLLSGFLLAKSFKKQKYQNALDCTLGKVKKLMPLNIVVVLAACIVSAFPKMLSAKGLLSSCWAFFINLVSSVPNIFFVQLFIPVLQKIVPNRFEAFPMWYISSMIVSSFLWFWLLAVMKSKFGESSKYRSWGLVSAVLVFSFLINQYDKTDIAFDEIVPLFNLPAGFFRGFAEIGLGIFLADYRFEVKSPILKNFLKIFFPALLFTMIFYAKYSMFDYVYVFFCAVTIIFEFSLQETPKAEKVYTFLGKAALPIYFTHAFVIFYEYTPLAQKFPALADSFYLNILVRTILVFATAFIAYLLAKPMSKLLNKLYYAVKDAD